MEDLGESGVDAQELSAASGSGIRLWHDDIRPAPEGWVWVRTNGEAKTRLRNRDVVEISLDHDLGLHDFTEQEIKENPDLLFGRGTAEETGYDLVNWMCEHKYVPGVVTIHSWNPDGAMSMAARLNFYGHNCTISPFVVPK